MTTHFICTACEEPLDPGSYCAAHPDAPVAEACPTCGGTGSLPDPTWPTGEGRCYDCNLPEGRCLG